MKTLLLLAALAPVVAGAGTPAPRTASDPFIRYARHALDTRLKDYPRARFRDAHVTVYGDTHRRVLCGRINAPNSYGAMTGWHDFVVGTNDIGDPYLYEGTDDVTVAIIAQRCTDGVQAEEQDVSGLIAASAPGAGAGVS